MLEFLSAEARDVSERRATPPAVADVIASFRALRPRLELIRSIHSVIDEHQDNTRIVRVLNLYRALERPIDTDRLSPVLDRSAVARPNGEEFGRLDWLYREGWWTQRELDALAAATATMFEALADGPYPGQPSLNGAAWWLVGARKIAVIQATEGRNLPFRVTLASVKLLHDAAEVIMEVHGRYIVKGSRANPRAFRALREAGLLSKAARAVLAAHDEEKLAAREKGKVAYATEVHQPDQSSGQHSTLLEVPRLGTESLDDVSTVLSDVSAAHPPSPSAGVDTSLRHLHELIRSGEADRAAAQGWARLRPQPTPLRARDPRSVGPYLLHERIGAGGMGVVFRASCPGSDRVFAVKVVHEHLLDASTLGDRRFLREMYAAVQVHGAHTAQVLDVGHDHDVLYMVMEHLEGPTLEHYVYSSGPVRNADALQLLAFEVASALATMHAVGITHRDLKPRNVLLTPTGPKVIDLGIAKVVDASSRISQTGQVFGTLGYMPPEVHHGRTPAPTSDVWTWACTLAFAASGRHVYPTTGSPAACVRAVLDDMRDPQACAALADLDRELAKVVDSALAPEPGDRPADGSALLAALPTPRLRYLLPW